MEPSRADFCHPYQPYSIQLQFMKDLYKTIEDGKVGIFESPTGTGKSLSLICGSLTWLRDHKRMALDGLTDTMDAGDDPEWMVEAERHERRRVILQQREELEARLSEVRRREVERKKRLASQSRVLKKHRKLQDGDRRSAEEKDDANYLPEDYDSDDQTRETGPAKQKKKDEILSSSTHALLAKLNGPNETADEPKSNFEETRIIFCSRTHSQLTQFVNELRRVKPPPSIISLNPGDLDTPTSSADEEIVKHLSLGSRKNLCINHKVSGLGSVAAINERCLDLQKKGVSEEQKCPFLPNKDSKDLVDSFRDHVLAEIRDIEDLSSLGRSMGICPYYASRSGIESSEILTLPYPLLLQKSAREALGVSVKGHVVIIDEAHNLMDAIADTHSSLMSLQQVETATAQVMIYVQKFRNRLKGKNRMYITQIVRVLNSISDCLRTTASSTRENEAILTPAQLLAGKGVDQIQPHGLIRYLQQSKLAHKVQEYVQSNDDATKTPTTTSNSRNALQSFQDFLAVLMNPSAEGRFFFSRDEQDQIHIRYTLLDPREHFRDIVEEARAVILAGGTMSPMSDYKDYLFSYLRPDQLKTFSFGHVVSSDNLFARSISTGPSGVEFDFTFEKRKSEKMIVELGLLFLNACKVIPDGVVAFFPSYDFLSHVVSVWKKMTVPLGFITMHNNASIAQMTTIFSALNAIKPIFYETKPSSSSKAPSAHPTANPNNTTSPNQSSTLPLLQESLLQSYTRTIDQCSSTKPQPNPSPNNPHQPNPNHPSTTTTTRPAGALLLSITSGTLSEGINFSDALGRAIIAIGLPYPNPYSAVWKAKLAHVEALALQKALVEAPAHSSASAASLPSTSTTVAPAPAPASAKASASARSAARDFYTNATLRSVNQAIGRVIRHRDDYAAVLLVDRRWGVDGEGGVRGKLPGWIREGLDGDRDAGGVRERDHDLGGRGGGVGGGSSSSGGREMGMGKSKRKSWSEIERGLEEFFKGKA